MSVMKHMFATKLKELDEKRRQQGIEKGIEQGIDHCIEKGIEQGKIDTAKNMLEDCISIERIAKYTGLSKEKIESIRKDG